MICSISEATTLRFGILNNFLQITQLGNRRSGAHTQVCLIWGTGGGFHAGFVSNVSHVANWMIRNSSLEGQQEDSVGGDI